MSDFLSKIISPAIMISEYPVISSIVWVSLKIKNAIIDAKNNSASVIIDAIDASSFSSA